jgi:hypothetical protein
MDAWNRYKSGHSSDPITLAICCAIMAVATFYLPEQHALQNGLKMKEGQGDRFYDVMLDILRKYYDEAGKNTLDIVELYLLRCHYLTLTKRNPEEIWSLRGDLMRISTAMGLHRDPDRFNISLEYKERLRWAWWHVLLLERRVF